MKLSAKQYIDWALHDLVAYARLLPIRSELPDLYGKSRLFDAAVVTNRVGRFVPVGLLLCAFMLGMTMPLLPKSYHILALLAALVGLLWGGWAWRGGAGLLIGFVVFIPIYFMDPSTWLWWLKVGTAVGLVVAGWRILAAVGAVAGLAMAAALLVLKPLTDLPKDIEILMAIVFVFAGWSILSRTAVVVALKAADGLAFTELVAELKQLSRLIPSPGSVDAFEYYGALVLVFEQPVPPAKRDQLISLRRASPMGRMLTDIWIVELDAGTMYALDTPWNVRPLVPVLEDALGRKGDAPEPELPPPSIGQRTARTSVAWATLGLVAFNVLVHVAAYTEYTESEGLRVLRAGLGHAELEAHGQRWRSITSMFLHGSMSHIVGNMIGLLEAGRCVELFFGTGWTIALYVLTGLAGNLLGDWHKPWMSLGASGAVFGMLGVLGSIFVFRGVRLSLRYRSHLQVAAAFAGLSLLNGLTGGPSNVGHFAHLGGALAGLLAGLVLPFKEEDGPPRWGGNWWGGTALACIAWAYASLLVHWEWTPSEFVQERSEGHRMVIDRPVGWWKLQSKDGAVVMIDGGAGGVVASRISADMRGIVTMPAGELKQYFEEWFRDSEGTGYGRRRHWRYPAEAKFETTIDRFEASFIPLSEGKALSLRFTATELTTIYEYFLIPVHSRFSTQTELLILPLEDGTQILRLESSAEDVEYYRPIFSRIKHTYRTLDPAFGNIPERGPG